MRTRIIATIGPACARPHVLAALVKEGVCIFRFNFSHGTMESHERMLERVRKVQQRVGRHIGILQDLAGHRIRTGHLAGGRPVMLQTGQQFALYRVLVPGSRRGVSMDYPGSFKQIRSGQLIFIEDGNIHLKILRSSHDRLDTIVIQEGRLGERKGVNIPGAPLEFPPISTKDIQDLDFAINHKIDYVAQSFVRNAADVEAVKRRLRARLPHCKVLAKIENREGIRNFAAILRACDGIMVARGDLGISVPIYEIPILQKWMIAACNHHKKPAITATQMLEHMIDHRQPTRAEVSDVANAVIDGSDFVMLSGETATGRYPVETVRMMRLIIEHIERHAPYRGVRRTR
ncbi:MAG: pyruvate kinase [Candidatus Omnitrophica bacterium]|nr:pyruvate kinase [Candidatus Omnitrophota bacterium]